MEWSLLEYYLLIINIIALVMFAIDKLAAIWGRSRIREVTLLGLTALGGSLGGLIAMYVFRHKIRKKRFSIGVPLIMVLQIIVVRMIIS